MPLITMKAIAVTVVAALVSFNVAAAPAAPDDARTRIAKTLNVSPDDVTPFENTGLYQVKHRHEFAYVTADGRYLLRGDMVDLKSREEVTENLRRTDRLDALKSLGSENMIEFAPLPPVKAQYTVTVFTDVDCGYCRKLHSEIKDYNAKGIAIRYAFFPRSGPDTDSWYRAESVWCSDDRRAALTKAKMGQDVQKKSCPNPVAREYQLGTELGVRGTPAMIMPDGELVPGYIPPDELAAHLAGTDKPSQDLAD
jgi:thiol:disulfide interchange protein DsbC